MSVNFRRSDHLPQCAVCAGEHDYSARIYVHYEDGDCGSEDRQICRNCLARFMVCLANDIGDIRQIPDPVIDEGIWERRTT